MQVSPLSRLSVRQLGECQIHQESMGIILKTNSRMSGHVACPTGHYYNLVFNEADLRGKFECADL